MADQDATLRGILERNVAAVDDETGGYHLNHVEVEIDASEVGPLDEGLEGLPVSVEGRFETREHPESGTRWVLKPAPYEGTSRAAEARSPALLPPLEVDPGEQSTGTTDEEYDLIGVVYHALNGAETIEAYLLDAEATGRILQGGKSGADGDGRAGKGASSGYLGGRAGGGHGDEYRTR